MELAKPALDVGLYTNNLNSMLDFWQHYAPYDELLKLGGGAHQHRHRIGDSILKVNNTRERIDPGAPTGISSLTIYRSQQTENQSFSDPDGNQLIVAPAREAMNLTLDIACNDVATSANFYASIMGLGAIGELEFQVGASSIRLSPGQVGKFQRQGLGFRYMTVQVFDVVTTHNAILEAGGTEGMEPTRLGDVAYISFVTDPDGNWIEISQRKSITGSLE